MIIKIPVALLVLITAISPQFNQLALAQQTNTSMPYILDMVHNNPGEPPFQTKYNDPEYIKSQGFNGMVTHWQINCAITYDNYEKGIVPKGSDTRKWIEKKAKEIDSKLDACEKAGIDVYPFTDFIVFPEAVWQKYGSQIGMAGKVVGSGGMDSRTRKPNIQSKITQELLRAQIAGIFNRFPKLDGLTLRFGETYLHDAPFHGGGSPVRPDKEGIADHITLINILRDEICVKRNKKLFYRTWDFGYNFHNNPDYYLAVTNQIEPHRNLVFSIKYQQGDFHRMTPFNPELGIGKHQQIVESQSRMEAYGKGAHPYYSAKGVIDGWPETRYQINLDSNEFTGKLNDRSSPRGIKDVLKSGLIKGVVTWSNGGGWQGPYIFHEIWTDLNTYVVSRFAQNPYRSEEDIFYDFAREKKFNDMDADKLRQIALLSIEGVRKGQCNSYTINRVWWARDEFFSVKENAPVVKKILQNNLAQKVLEEKAEASAIWQQIESISKQLDNPDKDLLEAIQVSCSYGRIKYELIEQMWILMLEDAATNRDKVKIDAAIAKYDALWEEWRALKASSKFCATLPTDMAFRNSVQGGIGEFVRGLKAR